jgi:hypothetical protein
MMAAQQQVHRTRPLGCRRHDHSYHGTGRAAACTVLAAYRLSGTGSGGGRPASCALVPEPLCRNLGFLPLPRRPGQAGVETDFQPAEPKSPMRRVTEWRNSRSSKSWRTSGLARWDDGLEDHQVRRVSSACVICKNAGNVVSNILNLPLCPDASDRGTERVGSPPRCRLPARRRANRFPASAVR